MQYEEALAWLFEQETMGIKFGLANVSELLSRMGDPQLRFRSVHVAGTNGKGSVSAMTSSVLREAGYRTGLYTSPHLVDFRERIQVDGVLIGHREMLRLAEEVRGIAETMRSEGEEKRLTFFELTTAMAFAHFADQGVEEAVVEVGMGGRLDATNVLRPDCSAITHISLEHTQYLGNTLAAIAGEKAGIIKPGVPVVTIDQSSEAMRVLEARSRELGSPLKVVGREVGFRPLSSDWDGTEVFVEEIGETLRVPLLGRYQAVNCALSVAVVAELMHRGVYIPEEAISKGMARVEWPGRLEVVAERPRIIFDVTHTPEGARTVAEEVSRLVGGKIILVLGVLKDKDLQGIAPFFGRAAKRAIATAPQTKRAFPPEAIQAALSPHCPAVAVEGVGAAIDEALGTAGPDDTILVTGSLYTMGEAMRWRNGQTGGRDTI